MNIRVKGDTVQIEGYVNAVERTSKPLKDRLGTFIERIKAGAFKRALSRAEDVRILLNHNWNRDLGGIKDGNLELYEDPIGLHAKAIIKDADVAEKARNGQLRGWSFGFTDRDVENGNENGMAVRNVNDLDLFEVSLIDRSHVPAYDGTLVTVRTADDTANINVAECIESEINIRVEEEPEPTTDNQAAETGAIDYTQYHNMIDEMKGEKS